MSKKLDFPYDKCKRECNKKEPGHYTKSPNLERFDNLYASVPAEKGNVRHNSSHNV